MIKMDYRNDIEVLTIVPTIDLILVTTIQTFSDFLGVPVFMDLKKNK